MLAACVAKVERVRIFNALHITVTCISLGWGTLQHQQGWLSQLLPIRNCYFLRSTKTFPKDPSLPPLPVSKQPISGNAAVRRRDSYTFRLYSCRGIDNDGRSQRTESLTPEQGCRARSCSLKEKYDPRAQFCSSALFNNNKR